ncbi:unnamed protein product [Closterium sp. Yama58-4]|nr:unnamed protein product [Closterium sp. Yama58-4]
MVIVGVTDYSPLRAGATSIAYKRPLSACGTGTMATGVARVPASAALPVAPAALPVAPAAPPLVPPAAVAPPVVPQTANLAAPSVGGVRAVVDGGVAAQSVESAATDILGPAALPAARAPPTAATLAPPPPALSGPALAPPVAAHPALLAPAPPAPLVAAPHAPTVAASQSNSPRVAPAPAALPGAAPSAQAAPLPYVAVPPPLAPADSTPVPRSHIRLPWVPPVAGSDFVTAAGGPETAQYTSLLPMDPPPPPGLQVQRTPTRRTTARVSTLLMNVAGTESKCVTYPYCTYQE